MTVKSARVPDQPPPDLAPPEGRVGSVPACRHGVVAVETAQGGDRRHLRRALCRGQVLSDLTMRSAKCSVAAGTVWRYKDGSISSSSMSSGRPSSAATTSARA